MSVAIDTEVFARLVGSYPEQDTLLFEVATMFVETNTNEWSPPMQWRFVRREGARVDLEFHYINSEPLANEEDV